MDFELSKQDEQFYQEVCDFLDREAKEEITKELEETYTPGPATRELVRKLGAKRWLTITWPREYGGMESTYIQRLILNEEMSYRRVRYSMVGAAMAGPTILLFGSDELKKEYLPRISSGEIEFALGYTEPEAGSDLARLDLRAVEDGDDYVMNGQKIYSSAAHFAECHWLGARTDPEAPRHRGISLFVVDLKTPGITVRPLWSLEGTRTNEVFYDDVRVPKTNLVGEKNRGFYHIATALDFERVVPTGELRRLLDDLVEYVKSVSAAAPCRPLDMVQRHKLAEMAIEIDIARLFAFRVAWLQDQGTIPNYESSTLKAYATELRQRLAETGLELLGLYGQLMKDSSLVQLEGRLVKMYLNSPIGKIAGGTSEIQRNIIAMRGLELPR